MFIADFNVINCCSQLPMDHEIILLSARVSMHLMPAIRVGCFSA